MKQFFTFFLVTLALTLTAQTGTIEGTLQDKESAGQPLPFANILIKGTSKGTTSDFDGNYIITNVEPGTYTLEFSFVGYETVEVPNVIVEADKFTRIDTGLGASAASLDEVIIKVQTSREREEALLIEQKNAVVVKESIGAQQLAKLGVSNASAATTKISGVTKTEGSGEIYVRGLGDRYLSTTLNGLPIPSDNIDKKNLDLALLPTRFIQSVGISKTFGAANSSDLASGNIDITSKIVSKGKDYAASLSSGINSNVADGDIFSNFKAPAFVNDDIAFGIYDPMFTGNQLLNAVVLQDWDPVNISTPINTSFGFNVGGILDEEKKWRLYFSGGQSIDNEYREGLFREFDQGALRDFVPENDNRTWLRTVNNTAMLHAQYRLNDENRFNFNSFLVNKISLETYEAGRERTTEIFEELDNIEEGSQFVRDQNIKNTLLSVTQLSGKHNLSETNTLDWAAGYNYVSANEPNRIRNELNILNDDPNTEVNEDGVIQFGFTGGFQQRKSVQEITDEELNARINDEIILKSNDDEEAIYTLNLGANLRSKTRDFRSNFFGIDDNSQNPIFIPSLDDLNSVFTLDNLNNGSLNLVFQDFDDRYKGELSSIAGYADFTGVFNKLTAQVGLRYQSDQIDVNWIVLNFPGNVGSSSLDYNQLYPYVNLKYGITEKLSLRFAGSLSQTLPEFKEIAPFQYQDPLGQVFAGNVDLERSENLNVDLKLEFFPESDELLSLSTFYKQIDNPINRGLQRGGEGIFSYFNTGDRATVFGIELEGRYYIIKKEQGQPNLRVAGNISYLSHKQDLADTRDENGVGQNFQYDGKTETGLEGASDWVTNASVSFSTGDEFPYEFTLSGGYASDKIFSLGAPRNQNNSAVQFNGEIFEKGFVTLDFIFNKAINKNLSIGLTAQNLLNPSIERYQENVLQTTLARSVDTILTYKRGIDTSLNISYKF